MKRWLISLLFFVATASVFGQTADKKSDQDIQTEREVKELCNQFANALVKKDVASLNRILSDDYGDIGLFSDLPTTKVLLMRVFKENSKAFLKNFDLDTNDSFIRIYGETAVVTIIAKTDGNGTGEQKVSYIATLVVAKQKGSWQLVVSHFSKAKFQASPVE